MRILLLPVRHAPFATGNCPPGQCPPRLYTTPRTPQKTGLIMYALMLPGGMTRPCAGDVRR